MSLSLRRACHACTKSKRRCTPQLPSCDRCAKKQISCVYDLEPVSQSETLSACEQDLGGSGTRHANPGDAEDSQIVYHSVKSAREASITAVANGHSTISPASRPKMFGSAELTQWVVNFFIDVLHDGSAGRGTPFAHPHILQSQSRPECLRRTAKCDLFHRLTEIHNIMMTTLTTLLLNKPSTKSDSHLDNLVTTLFSKSHTIWSCPPPNLNSSPFFTPWSSWLTAETIRRTMFAAQMIKGLFSFFRNGYVTYEPFFESLPFDLRAGLWEAQTEEAWEALVREKYGGEHVRLKSYHEFITGCAASPGSSDGSGNGNGNGNGDGDGPRIDENEDGKFQRLLYLCYHCDEGLEYVRGLGELHY